MAPKRKATGGKKVGSPMKKARNLGHQVTQSLHVVKAALKNKEYDLPSIPHEARELVFAAAEHALKGESEERHEFQTTTTRMIEQVLVGVRGKLEAALEETKKFAEGATEKEGELEHAAAAAKAAVEAKKEEIKERTAVKGTDTTNVHAAAKEVEKAKHAEKELEKTKVATEKEQAKFNNVYNECFKVLRAGPGDKEKEALGLSKKVTQLLHGLEGAGDSMVRGLPAAILKKVEDRGDFDKMTISAVDEILAKHEATLAAKLAGHDAEVQAGHAATQGAEQASDAATEKLKASTEALHNAENQKVECDHAVKDADKAIKEHAKRAKAAASELKSNEGKIADFAKVETSFNFLKTFTAKQPEVEEEEEPPQQEEAAAAAPAPMQE